MVVGEGEILAGKYRVERVLGQGGMGVVVAAEHVQLGQRVALKFLLPEVCSNGDAVARFLREARAAVQIQSEHVARVADVGTLESGAPFMVMEFLQGSDLSSVLAARGPLPVAEAVDYLLQAGEAIAEAHSLGIVHRDLKPANLFLTRRRDGSALIKVLDFGISKAAQTDAQGKAVNLTATATVMGSPLYMSPEQVRSARDVDGRADIWALGVILQELLAGTPPFVSDTASALFAMIVADAPVRLRDQRPDVPPGLEAVVLRCLDKDRTRRFESVAALARALQPFGSPSSAISVERIARLLPSTAASAEGFPSSAVGAASAPGVAATDAIWGTARSTRETGHSAKPRRKGVLIASVLGVALVGTAGAVLSGRLGEAPAAATASVSAPASALELNERPRVSVPSAAPPSPEPPAVTPSAVTRATASASPASAAAKPPSPSLDRSLRRPAPAKTSAPKRPAASSTRDKDLFDDTQ